MPSSEESGAKGLRHAPYDARSIANLVLERVSYHGDRLTQLQLYKIIYFAHGWYLARTNAPLVIQAFEAWKYGPVVQVLRNCFGVFNKGPITAFAEKLDIFTGELSPPDDICNEGDRSFIIQMVDFYRAYDGWELSDLTHEPGSPWDRVWNTKAPIGNLGLRIDDNVIKAYFVKLAQDRAIH